ncbi:glycosyltransferase [Vibrio profundum]|uniref:glycosyltransferase n=1 Tax=Vibrio profundum TaxID=2910247 RepID=UPI003D1444E8
MNSAKKVLFVHYGGDWIRGSERCLIDLITHIDRRAFTPQVWTNNESLKTEIAKLGVHCEVTPFPLLLGWQAPRFNVFAWKRLVNQARDIIQSEHIDLIHVNSAAPCQWMCHAAKLENVALVTQLHSDYPARDRLTLGIHNSPHIIAVSDAITGHLRKDGYPNEQLSVIHNGIDIERLSAQTAIDSKAQLGIANDDFLFVTVGSLIHRKGIDRILTALKNILRQSNNVHLLVIGEGNLRQTLEQTADRLNITEQVHFVGEKVNVLGWLQGCDAYVSAARSEAFGLVFMEAALAELPIVAPFEGGIKEILTHDETAILYENKGIKPLYDAMLRVIKHQSLADFIACSAKETALSHHTVTETTQRIEQIYWQVLQNPRPVKASWWRTTSPIRTYVTNRLAFSSS